MKNRILILIVLVLSGLRLFAQPMSDRDILSEIRENPYRAAACHSPYSGGEYKDTPAPAGYKPFYVSHFGRHGSRYQTSSKTFDKALACLDTLHKRHLLTPCGDSLRTEIIHIARAHKGMEGMLTGRGTREHTAIALNLARRCPEIFTQPDRPVANCRSTAVARTIQSMAGFSAGLLSKFPGLDLRINSGFVDVKFKNPEDKTLSKEEMKEIEKSYEKNLYPTEEELSGLASRLLTDPEAARDALGEKSILKFLENVFSVSSGAGCLDIAVDPLRFFTPEELFALYKHRDLHFNIAYGPFAPTREARGNSGKYFVRMMVEDADDALAGNGRCADFRFGHDGNLGPMMTLLGIGPFQYASSPEAPYRDWQSYRYICMASNLQLIFYRNSSGEVLVKTLYNEREIDYPGLKPVRNVYYKWSDVRRYIVSKTDGIVEVPDYYKAHLKAKSAQISALQKDEADGFYFITDTHYPANFGQSAALIESLEKTAGTRRVIHGGDVLTYVDDMDQPIAQQISALEQIRGAAPLYWIRGNHDFVNYTGRQSWNTVDRKALYQWEAASVLARFREPDAVSDPEAPYSAYFYFDNSRAKIRYIAIESTDSVVDNKIVYGTSERQLRWIAEEAVLKAPKDYKIVFFSHVPFIKKEDKRNKAMRAVVDEIKAVRAHGSFSVGGKTYDFSARPDLTVLTMVCAHHHSDYEKDLGGGLTQINVIADCNYKRITAAGTPKEQAFAYFSISKDYKTIRIVGIGAASDRTVKLY